MLHPYVPPDTVAAFPVGVVKLLVFPTVSYLDAKSLTYVEMLSVANVTFIFSSTVIHSASFALSIPSGVDPI